MTTNKWNTKGIESSSADNTKHDYASVSAYMWKQWFIFVWYWFRSNSDIKHVLGGDLKKHKRIYSLTIVTSFDSRFQQVEA